MPLSEEDSVLRSIYASMNFLLNALAEDLNTPIPSKESAFLYLLNDRVCLVRSLVEQLEYARFLLSTVDRIFCSSETDPIAKKSKKDSLERADVLLQALLKMLNQERPLADILNELAHLVQIPVSSQARIYFFTQLYQQVHAFPLRLFRLPERREDILCSIQDALDNIIVSEEQ